MSTKRAATRRKILAAAADIAEQVGPGNLSLDAVAARAGVSKGGLLYHFPSKTKLFQAVVANFVDSFDKELVHRKETKAGKSGALLEAYLELFIEDHECRRPPPSGLLAAMAQDPDFLAPVRQYHRTVLDRICQTSSDPAMALVVYLAIQGVRTMNLLDMDVLSDAEFGEVATRLKQIAATT